MAESGDSFRFAVVVNGRPAVRWFDDCEHAHCRQETNRLCVAGDCSGYCIGSPKKEGLQQKKVNRTQTKVSAATLASIGAERTVPVPVLFPPPSSLPAISLRHRPVRGKTDTECIGGGMGAWVSM